MIGCPITGNDDCRYSYCDVGKCYLRDRVPTPAPERTTDPTPAAMLQELWYDLVEKDDRTSPEEYPDMAMLTRDEFFAYLRVFAQAAVERERERCRDVHEILRAIVDDDTTPMRGDYCQMAVRALRNYSAEASHD